MSDLIDRQALLKQIDIDSDREPGYYGDTWKFIDTIKNMPNVHDLPKDTDTISRKGAIDALRKMQTYKLFSGDDMLLIDQAGAQTELMMLPPAQLGANLAEVGTDLISRAKAIEALKQQAETMSEWSNRYAEQRKGILTAVNIVEDLPPAQPEQPEPKRGEWLERDVIDEPKGKHITQWQSARCSVCRRYHTTPYLYSFTHYNFCPNCGAEMEVTT